MPLAFFRTDLNREGAIRAPDAAWDSFQLLKNDIHPLFAFENWNDLPANGENKPEFKIKKSYYDFLAPSFKLASKWIAEDHCLDWWCKLVRGSVRKERCHPECGERDVLTYVDVDAEARLAVKNTFNAMAAQKLVRFSFQELEGAMKSDTNNPNPKMVVPDKMAVWGVTTTEKERGVVTIRMSTKFHGFSKKKLKDKRVRFFFLFANTLVHEVSHAVCFIKRGFLEPNGFDSLVRIKLSTEPFHSVDETEAEIGYSWEYFMVGGFSRSLNTLSVGEYGLFWRPMMTEEARHYADVRKANIFAAVATESILNFFDDGHWTRVESEGLDALPIVVTHAKAEKAITDEWPKFSNELKKRKKRCVSEIYGRGRHPHGRVKKGPSPYGDGGDSANEGNGQNEGDVEAPTPGEVDPPATSQRSTSSKKRKISDESVGKAAKRQHLENNEESKHPLDFFD